MSLTHRVVLIEVDDEALNKTTRDEDVRTIFSDAIRQATKIGYQTDGALVD